jgi:hypothetical protein
MQRRLVIGASSEGSEVDVGWTLVGQGRDAHLAEHMQAVCRDGHTDLVEVVRPKAGQLRIAQVLNSSKIFGLVLCRNKQGGSRTTCEPKGPDTLLYS